MENVTASKGTTGQHRGMARLEAPDTFDSSQNDDDPIEPPRASVDLEDLPIELIGLTDSFIDSLSAKTHSAPPNVDHVSRMFQDFYATAASHINTHIATLSSRWRREVSPAPSTSSKASAASILRARAASIGSKDKSRSGTPRIELPEQQMITADELADRKRARKALEHKRVLLEEAVERRLCEGIYSRIYRHRSSQDEAQDDMLRSKTAALAVVGIGLKDLGVEIGDPSDSPEMLAQKAEEVRKWLGNAREELIAMHQSRYPLGKLNHLKAAHKSIVDTLSHFHPSSSADEIMPMLIYTLITLPPENLSVISDLNFIQRFRWEPKLVGEAAYCLTNLEAAVSFLETVDLSTLRADEAPSGPAKSSSQPGTPRTDTFPPAYSSPGLSAPTSTAEVTPGTAAGLKPSPSSTGLRAAVQLRNRRLSDLVNTPAQALGAASDAVFTTADQGLKTISNSLGDSYKFLLGKLREREDEAPGLTSQALVPKTLDDARKLISTPPPDEDVSLTHEDTDSLRRAALMDDKMLHLIGGRKTSRDHSADSSRSTASSKRVGFVEEPKDKATTPSATPHPSSGTGKNPDLMDSVRNLGNSLNPMARIAGMGGFRGFGRTASNPVTPSLKEPTGAKITAADGGDLATAFPDLATALPPKEIPKISPPSKRFMELQNPADLRIGEVLELLRDYRRLAGALKDRGAFKE
ncbi:Vacuolar protein sorting-associated protein 9b [Pleurostoma richardsiae]|uniref:Vacuolar protein sorting-associated protein 9b n=1 Tax=Pleurostoma richardsiae TaxID=41990 RepID=A0AA38S816_9PEZI|nr:Vacuolar protein sorting-associated protein 9b [Pleurostoma richardsiae]